MDLGLQDKGVLVTGASGNIGRATAVAFGAEGARVGVAYHRRRAEAQDTAKAVVKAGGRATLIALDLAEPAQLGTAVTGLERDLGGIDVLVNNAVMWPARGPPGELFESVPLERLCASAEANLVGPYALTQAVVASMRARGWGRIVHVSTGLVEDGFPGSSPYTTPKAALHGLTRTMSRELAPAGIFTNLVMGGYVPHGEVPPAVLEQASLSAATGRPTEAWEVANLIVFLCSAANGHITGEAIRADGHFLTRTQTNAGLTPRSCSPTVGAVPPEPVAARACWSAVRVEDRGWEPFGGVTSAVLWGTALGSVPGAARREGAARETGQTARSCSWSGGTGAC